MLLLSFGGSLTVTGDPLASQPGTITVSDDWPSIALTVDNLAAVAFAQRFQRLGVRADLADVTLPAREIGDECSIVEDAELIGDRLKLRLVGERFSPFARKLLQSKAPLDLYFRTGSPQHEFLSKVFTGFVVSSDSYEIHPPSVTVTALDAAGLYAERRAKDWSLPPNSGRTRLSIAIELLGIGGIPIRSLDLGANGGGVVNKPHTLGDRTILDFLRDFLAVLGVEIGFEEGGFVARRYDANQASVLELNPSNLLPQLSLAAPDTLVPNVLGVVSTSSTRIEIGGYVTEDPLRVVVTGPYAPDTAVEKIDGGVVTATGLVPTEAVQTISESITTVTKFGGVAVRTERVERGWLAERAAGAQVVRTPSNEDDPEAYDVEPVPGTVWIFSDGSTRAVQKETFRDLTRSVTTKNLDAQNRVVGSREERDSYRSYARALFHVDENASILSDLPPQGAVPIGDDGMGMMYGREVFAGLLFGAHHPTELTEWAADLNDNGEIISETTSEYYHQLPAVQRRRNGARGFGLDNRTYRADEFEGIESPFDFILPWRGLRVTTKTYRELGEDSYQVSVSVREGSKAPTVTTSDPIIGALPKPEKAEPSQSSQEILALFEDRARIALAGEEIADIEHNEFVETQAEAEVYARHRARLKGAITLSCTMPIEGLLHKWRMVTVRIPGASIDGLRFYVRSVHRDAKTFSQAIVADYYSI